MYVAATRRSGPTVWCKERSTEWRRGIEEGMYGEEWWRENLRMSMDTFLTVCNRLRPHIERQATNYREPISVEVRVAVTVWRLATNTEYRTISALFGLGRSTVCEIVLETCEMIAHHLMPRYVAIPNDEGLREIVDGFNSRWGFPQTFGAIDGSHIPILRPEESSADYFNRKGYHSILMQAVVDFRGRFLDVNIGWPGKVHDARVLINSSFYRKASTGSLVPDWSKTFGGVRVPLLVLGDPAYPLLPWLMKPYIETPNSTDAECKYNYRQSRARMVVENAFGRLKGRWRCLSKRIDLHVSNVPHIVAACVTLHNICEIAGDHCFPEWILEDSTTRPQSNSTATAAANSAQASSIRNAIRDYLE